MAGLSDLSEDECQLSSNSEEEEKSPLKHRGGDGEQGTVVIKSLDTVRKLTRKGSFKRMITSRN